jgi:hypothetical protein
MAALSFPGTRLIIADSIPPLGGIMTAERLPHGVFPPAGGFTPDDPDRL